MKFFIVLFALLCVSEGIGYYWHHSFRHERRNVTQEPRIYAYSPKGLKIKLHTSDRPSAIKFTGTIYRDSSNLPLTGMFTPDVSSHRQRKWIYENKECLLKIGDILNYEVFMEGKGGSSYKMYDGNAEIYDLVNELECLTQRCRPSNVPPYPDENPPQKGTATAPPTEKPITVNPKDTQILEAKLKGCQQGIINTTNALLELQSQVLRLESRNELLINVLNKSPDAKKLTISGVIPPSGTPAEIVDLLVYEKLDIKPHITSASRVNATTIVFQVQTIDQKLEILEEAEDRLVSGRIVIF